MQSHIYTLFIASFQWTPEQETLHCLLLSIHRDIHMGLWNFIWLAAGN